jgi:hypothetical protein
VAPWRAAIEVLAVVACAPCIPVRLAGGAPRGCA